jgi:hypothetical protein
MTRTRIEMNENNKMYRFGWGKNEGIWFIRLDLGLVGYRWKFDEK